VLPALELSELTKSFGRTRAVDRVSATIEAGASAALLGPNGAGKTTFLKLCSTLLRPSAGALRIAGYDAVNAGIEVRRRTALLGHDAYLYPDLSALENLLFYARLFKIPHPRERALAAIERLGLSGFSHRPVRAFSRGMLQRCTLARVFLQRPEVLLLDEPFSGLDLDARTILHEVLTDLSKGGTTLIMTTHDLEEAASLCTSSLILVRGRLAWHGALSTMPAADLRRQYEQVVESEQLQALDG
jgi:heme exporter protein A